MGGNSPVSVALRFVFLLGLQVLVFRQIALGWGGADYVFLFATPLFVGTLPLRTPKPLVVLAGFAFGMAFDFFYGTLGLHAAAATLLGYGRRFVLAVMAPRNGYDAKSSPQGVELPRVWWVRYLGLLTVVYCLTYFSVESFSPVFWRQIGLKTLFTVPLTWLVLSVLALLMRPRL